MEVSTISAATPNSFNEIISTRKNSRTRAARKRRDNLQKQTFRIYDVLEPRKLRKSARKQIDRERAPGLWIFPWVMTPSGKFERAYPRASLLGLPVELRQRILYEAFDSNELGKGGVRQWRLRQGLSVTAKAAKNKLRQEQEKALNKTLTPLQSHFITMVGQRFIELRCVSQLIRLDMDYVRKVWQRELVEQLKLRASKDSLVGDERILTNDLTALNKGWKGAVIKAKKHGRFGKRPSKCWRCNERHEDGDPVCPMAREDPKQWHRLTTKVGGRRGGVQPRSIFQGKKVVFGDN
jgi:hypothetical protein